jgi:molybdopterin/thiamine biosynthesis adenylyltransferase
MKPWWERLPGRLLDEDSALRSLREGSVPIVKTHRWVRETSGEPRLIVELVIGSGAYELDVRFPAHYPEGCPSVRPADYKKAISTHQFVKSGVFCLELGPDNWHPRHTAADMVTSAWRLIMKEIIKTFEPIEIASRHVPDLAEQVRLGEGVLGRTTAFDELVRSADANVEFEFAWPARNPLRAFPVAFPKGTPLPDLPPALTRDGSYAASLIRMDEGASETPPRDPQEFQAFVADHGHVQLEEKTPYLVLLRWPDGTIQGFFRLKTGVRTLVDVPIQADVGARTPRDLSEALSKLKVGIVGMGSLGSKIAVSLARSGLRRFVLVDGGILLGHNVCRNAASFADVGAQKIDAVKELIRDLVPSEPEIALYGLDVSSPTHPESHARLLEDLASADLLIDATANPEVFGPMAMLASDRRRPLVWGEVFGGGLGGLVASAHPEHGPCPRCVRQGFLSACSAWPPAPDSPAGIPYGGAESEPVVATDADVSFVAAALTNRVFDLVAQRDPSLPAVMLLGLRRGWIFEAPVQSVAVRVRSDDWSCERCWTPDSEPDAEIEALAEALFSAQDDAQDPPAA